ncbi:MAG: enoyl-CoA hydratase/isomerase family protein, partial [Planctomycetales bacterium]|nr:enoyl-CoA hydratase/isomerase family protein [Planctomycetales bacterium]
MIKYTADEQHIATLTLNRDDKRNAFSGELAKQILMCFADAESNGVRVLILRANPGVKVWCAGHDLAELDLAKLDTENAIIEVAKKIQSVPFPVIAMVEGSVHGGGLLLLLSADSVIAAE